ncbi:hypothetical protein BURPS305_5937 [Burkholderia pseudomallei 305]|nr:hypothetical protein BURPS305_5937 [Burkholderia pseudomallei 305]
MCGSTVGRAAGSVEGACVVTIAWTSGAKPAAAPLPVARRRSSSVTRCPFAVRSAHRQ